MMLHAQVSGPDGAPPLVLLGSIGSTTDMWTPILAPLLEQFRVVRIDHRGHGGSAPSPPTASVALADLAGDVLQTLDDLDLVRVDLAGLSLGGMVGMWLAAHAPHRIGRLALLCTSADLTPHATWRDRAATVRQDGMTAIADAVVARWVTPSLAGRDPDLMTALRDMVVSIDAESYAQCCQAIETMDLRADLARIASPTMVIATRDDPATPPEHAQVIADGVAGSSLHVLDHGAHVATYEAAGELAALLREHFRAGATLEAGLATRRAVLGDEHVDRALSTSSPITQPWQEFLTRYAWGDVWSRTELSRRERSITTLAALTTLGAEHELSMHVRAALRNGLSPEQIVEVLMHTALYAGLPRANRAIALAREQFADETAQGDDHKQ